MEKHRKYTAAVEVNDTVLSGVKENESTEATGARENHSRTFSLSDMWSIRKSVRGFRIHERKPRL